MFRKKKRERIFTVTVHCDGRHPYLIERTHDHPTRDVVLNVPAYDWNDAQQQAIQVVMKTVRAWRWYVTKIEDYRSEKETRYHDREEE